MTYFTPASVNIIDLTWLPIYTAVSSSAANSAISMEYLHLYFYYLITPEQCRFYAVCGYFIRSIIFRLSWQLAYVHLSSICFRCFVCRWVQCGFYLDVTGRQTPNCKHEEESDNVFEQSRRWGQTDSHWWWNIWRTANRRCHWKQTN